MLVAMSMFEPSRITCIQLFKWNILKSQPAGQWPKWCYRLTFESVLSQYGDIYFGHVCSEILSGYQVADDNKQLGK